MHNYAILSPILKFKFANNINIKIIVFYVAWILLLNNEFNFLLKINSVILIELVKFELTISSNKFHDLNCGEFNTCFVFS